MRIAYVIPRWPPLVAQTFVVNEMLEVAAAGEELVACPLRPNAETLRHATYAGLAPVAVTPAALVSPRILRDALRTVARHPVRVVRALYGAHRGAGSNPWAHARILAVTPKGLAAALQLRELGVDHIHAHFASNTAACAALAGQVSGIPYSFTAHAYDIYLRTPRHRNDTLAWKLRHADQAVAISDDGAGVLRSQLAPGERDRVHVIGVGISTRLFAAQPPAPRGDALELLSVGRLVRKKGFDTLVDACALLRDQGMPVRAHIVGDGPERAALEAQIARLALEDRVFLEGRLAQEQIAERMRACHALVLPCRAMPDGDRDGIPTVLMEAMASGRPVVSCPVSGIPELVRDHDTGLLVPSGDAGALAAALGRLGSDDALRERLGAAGPAVIEAEHDQARNAAALVALWRRAG